MALAEVTRQIRALPDLSYDTPEDFGPFPVEREESSISANIMELLNLIAEDVRSLVNIAKIRESIVADSGLSSIVNSIDAMHEGLAHELSLNTAAIKELGSIEKEENRQQEKMAEDKEDREQFRAQRESAKRDKAPLLAKAAAGGKKIVGRAGDGLASVMDLVKNLFTGFVSRLPMIVGGLLIGASAFLDPEELNNVFNKLKEKVLAIAKAVEPIVDIFMKSVWPSMKRLAIEGMEMLGVLFSDYIIPGVKAILPLVGKVFSAISNVVSWITDALKNPIETGRRLMMKLENNMLNLVSFLLDGIDSIKMSLGEFINRQIDKVSSFIPAAEKLKNNMAEEAKQNIARRAEKRKERESDIAALVAKKAARDAKKENPQVNTKLVELMETRNYIINNSEMGINDSRVLSLNREINQIQTAEKRMQVGSSSNVVDIRSAGTTRNTNVFAPSNTISGSSMAPMVSSTSSMVASGVTTTNSAFNTTTVAKPNVAVIPMPSRGPLKNNVSVSAPTALERLSATEMISAITSENSDVRSAMSMPSAPTIIDGSNNQSTTVNSSQTYVAPQIETIDPREKYYYNTRK